MQNSFECVYLLVVAVNRKRIHYDFLTVGAKVISIYVLMEPVKDFVWQMSKYICCI